MLELAGVSPLQEKAGLDAAIERRIELRLIDADGRSWPLATDRRGADGFRAGVKVRPMIPEVGIDQACEVEVSLVSHEARAGLGLQILVSLDTAATRFMIPGIIYADRHSSNGRARYPRVSLNGSSPDPLTGDRWTFRADRTSHGAVMGWTASSCIALAIDETSPLGPTGIGFRGGPESCLIINAPAREEPVTYLGQEAPAPAEVMTHDWQPDEIVTLSFLVFLLPPEEHAYDAVLRSVYRRHRDRHELNPWMDSDEAAGLAAHGLYRWHYREATGTLSETTAFHRQSDEAAAVTGDRDDMHVGWLSGAPSAYALLTYGRTRGVAEYADAAVRVLDTIASGLAPCGLSWGRWTNAGWNGGWNGHPDRIHMRTVGEATLFMIRAADFERRNGREHPAWTDAIASNLRFALHSQREDGALPALINGVTGAADSWDGAAGLMWIPAWLEGAKLLSVAPSPTMGEGWGGGFCEAAELAGFYYARFVEQEAIYGAPEDVGLATTSEDGYNAVMAYVSLYEANGEERWLRLACRAADWMLSFRWSYNLDFPPHTLLESYRFCSRGADLASPRNQHLHGYGLICLPEMVRLAAHSGDSYYLDRTRDNLACFLQFIAREDGDFNARKGMVSERYYNSRCFGPKGSILPVSHAWSAGLVLYACQAGLSVND